MRRFSMLALLLLGGCVSDPRDPNTWIKKLNNPVEQKDAVRELVKLKDPVAVPPLIEFYGKNHDPEVLKAIATFKDKRAVPTMIDSLEFSEESFDNAATAAAALGETPEPSAVDPVEPDEPAVPLAHDDSAMVATMASNRHEAGRR